MRLTPIDIGSFWLPRQTSTIAPEVDYGFNVVYWVSVGFFVLVVGAMILFAVRYRRRREGEKTSTVDHSTVLEIVWTNLIAKRQEIGRQLLRRGIERGDVRADTNLDVVMNMVAGTAIFAVLFRLPEPDDLSMRLESLVKTLWQGIQAHTPEAAPIHPADAGGSVTNTLFRDR